MWTSPPTCAAPLHSSKPSTARRPAPSTRRSPPKRQNRISMPGIHFREVVCMLGIFGLFLQAAAGHILYLALHLESGSFPRPLPPDRERAALPICKGRGSRRTGAGYADPPQSAARRAYLQKILCREQRTGRHDLHRHDWAYQAVDTFDPAKGKRFASYASRCIENAILTPTRFARQTVTVYRKPPLAGMYLRSFPLLIT